MQLTRAARGFTLTELAVVFAIIALLIGGAMATLSSQVEKRNDDETRRRLDAAVEALIAYAIVNRRLPCPATAGTTGDEAPAGGTAACTTSFGGFLPARTIGIQTVDSQFYALDAWGNRIRYALSNSLTGCTGGAAIGPPFFTSQANLKTNGVSCRPNDIDICAPTTIATACTAANRVVSTETVAFIVFSTGKNGSIASAHGAHELANLDGDGAFISRTPSGADSTLGTYDDILVWVPAGMLYSKLISAGVLP
jgi:prepilin-type N-terminal cleavage/methylation domain-containing protein